MRQISVVSVSPVFPGEVNRDAIEVMLAATPPPSSATNARDRAELIAQPPGRLRQHRDGRGG
ncbi:hypothetical protein MAHJHV28_47170 [Mycobacterium avium subsp. hominissuis]